MAYDLTERLDEATKQANISRTSSVPQAFGAIPPTLGNGLSGQAQVAQNTGYVTGTEPGVAPTPMVKPGFDQNGIVTADSAKAAMAAPMERSGGIAGGIDMKGANAVLARENATRQQMIDAQVGGGTGKPVSWQDQHGNADPEKQRIADSNALLNKWDKQYQNQQAVAEMGRNPRAAQGIANLTVAAGHDETMARGQDLNFGATMAQQGITARGQDLNNQRAAAHDQVIMRGQDISGGNDAKRLGIDQSRLGIQQADSARADAKWGVESGILKGQAADSEAVRSARNELTAAITSGDPTKIEAAKAKAVASGIKFDKPNNEFSAVTDSMGMNVTRTNKDTGAVDIINPKTGEVKSIAAPGQQKAVAPVPQGHTVVGTSGGKRVLQDAYGKRFIEGGN